MSYCLNSYSIPVHNPHISPYIIPYISPHLRSLDYSSYGYGSLEILEKAQAHRVFPSRVYLEGHWDLVSRLVMGMIGVTIWVTGVITYLLSPHDPPSRV